MDITQIGLLEVLSGTVVGMALGAFWYSPAAFGPAWMASIGKTPETLGGQVGPMLGSIIACLLTATGVALLQSAAGTASLGAATALGLVLGLMVIFPALLSDNLFCGWGSRLLLIQSGYRVLTVLLMSVVIFLL